MKRFFLAILAAGLLLIPARSEKANPFAGRWDLTITAPKITYPSWMEFTEKDGQPSVRVVGRTGSVHPATEVKLDGGRLSFVTTEWFGKDLPVTWQMQVSEGKLTGTQKRSDGFERAIAGVPAPEMKHPQPTSWTDPEPLFNGKDLAGWEPDNAPRNHWAAENGELVNQRAGANLRTTRKFGDFKLHIEYNCPPNGNSGVYLRGRYEIQVEYEKAGENDQYHLDYAHNCPLQLV